MDLLRFGCLYLYLYGSYCYLGLKVDLLFRFAQGYGYSKRNNGRKCLMHLYDKLQARKVDGSWVGDGSVKGPLRSKSPSGQVVISCVSTTALVTVLGAANEVPGFFLG